MKWSIVLQELAGDSTRFSLLQQLLNEFHCKPIGDHVEFLRTYKLLQKEVYWEGIKLDVQMFVATCFVCQQMKHDTLSPIGLLQPLPMTKAIVDDVSIDFIEGLSKS